MTLRVKVDGSFVETGGAGGAEADEHGWIRPADWLAMPEVAATDQVFYGLHAVYDAGSNFATIRCTGAFTVDWGDGTVEDIASNTTAEHEYDFADVALNGTLTSLGYKQALVHVYPQAGQTLSNINTSLRHSKTSVNLSSSQWLDIRLAMNNAGTVTNHNIHWRHLLLQRFEWIGTNEQLFSNRYSYMRSLQSWKDGSTTGGPASWTFSDTNIRIFDKAITLSSSDPRSMFANSTVERVRGITVTASGRQIFAAANHLKIIEDCDFSAMTADVGAFATAPNLCRIRNTPMPAITFTIANCSFNRAGLVEVFEQLPDRTGFASPTITITGNWGIADLTAADRLIATNKNWTIVE